MTESININSLAYHHIWSTIKNLPATLPEPSFKVRGSSAGVTGAVFAPDFVCFDVLGVSFVMNGNEILQLEFSPKVMWRGQVFRQAIDNLSDRKLGSFFQVSVSDHLASILQILAIKLILFSRILLGRFACQF